MKTDLKLEDLPQDTEDVVICTICREINQVDTNTITEDFYCQDCGTKLISFIKEEKTK